MGMHNLYIHLRDVTCIKAKFQSLLSSIYGSIEHLYVHITGTHRNTKKEIHKQTKTDIHRADNQPLTLTWPRAHDRLNTNEGVRHS